MPFDWREYLRLAESLESGTAPAHREAAGRTAVSRAYYAAFCRLRNVARDHEGFVPRGTEEDHVRLRDHLRNRNEDRVAQELGRLRHWRNSCDYHDDVPNLEHAVAFSILTAKEILNRL